MAKKKTTNISGDQKQIEQLTEALMRERADALNMRRRFDEQMASVRSAVKASLIGELLPIIDNFERALKHIPKDLKNNDYINGVQAIVKQFDKTLQEMGVERIESVGKEFDPKYHEAVSMEDGSGAKEIVSEELQAGYKIGDVVIRHSVVKVKLQ